MNVASLELCKELYELSRWYEETKWYQHPGKGLTTLAPADDEVGRQFVAVSPAYSLGYLLRKLQGTADREWSNGWLYVEFKFGWDAIDKNWMASWKNTDTDDGDWFEATGRYGSQIDAIAETPEDALCKLAIELFKQGILEKAS